MASKNSKEEIDKNSSDYNNGYKKGYESKDYTWGDGWYDAIFKWAPDSETHKAGYAEGERDRIRDDAQKGKK